MHFPAAETVNVTTGTESDAHDVANLNLQILLNRLQQNPLTQEPQSEDEYHPSRNHYRQSSMSSTPRAVFEQFLSNTVSDLSLRRTQGRRGSYFFDSDQYDRLLRSAGQVVHINLPTHKLETALDSHFLALGELRNAEQGHPDVPSKAFVQRSSYLRHNVTFSGHQRLEPPGQEAQNLQKWAVCVTIWNVNWDDMTLCGSMNANHFPTTGPVDSVKTYWEGEIIDFTQHHTFKTGKWSASTQVDATYWRRLEPFRDLDDDELAKVLFSIHEIKHISDQYVFMRWKEKNVIESKSLDTSLTIAGFYFASLRRKDGYIEGFYYDPSSSPYQHLHLHPTCLKPQTFPAVSIR